MRRERWLVLGILVASVGFGPAGAVRGAEEEGAAPPVDAAREKEKGRIREIQRKLKAGEELTAEERALVEKARNRLGKDGREPGAPAGPGRVAQMIEGVDLVNALDAVRLQLAQAHLARNETDKAVAVLEALAKDGRDKTSAGFARLALARIFRQKGDAARSDEELGKVTGPAMAGALAMLAGPGGESAARLEELLKSVDEPLARAMILRRLSALYVQNGSVEKLADLAERSAKLLSYKDAQAAMEAEARLQQRQALMGRPGGLPGARPGMPGGPEGDARKGGEPRRGDDADALRREIKELEDAGMVDEAEALKRQLKAVEERKPKKGGVPREGGKPVPNDGENVF
ncbi:MAG TPA: hypothetical protein PK280_20970 [Planctomycetota bacterium]|nr:hypothetical protein [Planctomycetota bacterium]